MAGAEVKMRATFDRSNFEQGRKSVVSGSKEMASSLAKIGGVAAIAGIAGATAAIIKLGAGTKKVLDLGSRLDDFATRLGMDGLAGEVMVLDRVFREGGLSGEMVATTLQKMQRAIGEGAEGIAEYADTFERAGLDVEELLELRADQQFEKIAKAIASMGNATLRSQTALDIFGRSGGQLMTVFRDPQAIDKAREAIGGLAGIMNESARDFDRASDIINNFGDKASGFFAGFASIVIEDLLGGLEKANTFDFSKLGQNLGRAIEEPFAAAIFKINQFLTNEEFRKNLTQGILAGALQNPLTRSPGGKEFRNTAFERAAASLPMTDDQVMAERAKRRAPNATGRGVFGAGGATREEELRALEQIVNGIDRLPQDIANATGPGQ